MKTEILLIFSLILFLVMIILILCFLYNRPNKLLDIINHKISNNIKKNNYEKCMNISDYENFEVKQFHKNLYLNHEDISDEILKYIDNSKNKKNSNNYDLKYNSKNNNNNNVIQNWITNENKWNPIWLKKLGKTQKVLDNLPLLKNICFLFPNIENIYISVLEPGQSIINQQNYFKSFIKYNYCLKLSDQHTNNNLIDNFIISQNKYNWSEKEGYIWDDTLEHSFLNYSNGRKIIIFASINRENNLSLFDKLFSKITYNLIKINYSLNLNNNLSDKFLPKYQ